MNTINGYLSELLSNEYALRILLLLIGYLFGNIMTAQITARVLTGKPASALGTTGNPGMANIMASLGFWPGICVLAGDLAKCLAALGIAYLIHGPLDLPLALLYAGTGVTIGHNYPFTLGFRGGKGVATTCILLFTVSPLWGLVSVLAGMIAVLITKYLCVGGVLIPAVFTCFAFPLLGTEAGCICLFLTAMMFLRHFSALRLIPSGQCEKVDVLAKIKKKFQKKPQQDKQE